MKVKSLFCIPVIAILFMFLFCATLAADPISTEGEWDPDERLRETSSAPQLSFEGNFLQIYFPETLVDLAVCVKRLDGVTLYEGSLNGMAGESVFITLPSEKGCTCYVLLTHRCGWLMGEFNIQ